MGYLILDKGVTRGQVEGASLDSRQTSSELGGKRERLQADAGKCLIISKCTQIVKHVVRLTVLNAN